MSTQPTQAQPARQRPDWEAIERDYRTGRFSDQELANKHGNLVTRQAISKRAKVRGWQKDLTEAVRQATKASLIAEVAKQKVAEQVATGCEATVDAVVVAAEANKRVILGHRQDILTVRSMLMAMAAELQQAGRADLGRLAEVLSAGAADDLQAEQLEGLRSDLAAVARLPTRILSVQRLSQALTRLQQLERLAFGLDEPEQPPPVDPMADLSDEELDARIREYSARVVR